VIAWNKLLACFCFGFTPLLLLCALPSVLGEAGTAKQMASRSLFEERRLANQAG
jgi:hypothetical protein